MPDVNAEAMISNQSTQTTYRPYALSYDSPATERKNCDSPSSEASNATEPVVDRIKLMQMVTFLDKQNQQLQNDLAREKQRRNEELSVIIKSLICMESKLKLDKKRINQRLLRNDTEIFRLICLNRLLRKKLDDAGLTKDDLYLYENLQCFTCKQKFYAINTKDNFSQTSKDGEGSIDQPAGDVSSDDTMSSSFNGARRCVRYTSKRTFGTFRDYMYSRSMNLDDNFDNQADNASTISCDDSQKSSKASDKLHEINRFSSIEYDLDSDCEKNIWPGENHTQQSLGGAETNLNFPHVNSKTNESKTDLSPYSSKSNSLSRSREFLETPPKNKFETSSDNWYASASDGEDDQAGVQTNLYGYKVTVNPVLECVNQILLQQSMEEPTNDCDLKPFESTITKLNNRDPGKTANSSRKRVHFSTKNSMAPVPRDNTEPRDQENLDIPLQQLSSPNSKLMIASQIRDNILNYESIYSNEYEPIGSENNSSHLYVDMEAKLSPDDIISFEKKNPKQPPALPPKPANLMKLNKIYKPNEVDNFPENNDDNKSILSEPDYCSISELNPTTPTFVQVVADVHVHKEQHFQTDLVTKCLDSDKQQQHKQQHETNSDDIDEIFASIPKISNFAPPPTPPSGGTLPKPEKTITNCSIKSRPFELLSKPQRSPRQFKRKNVPNILAEINKRMTYSFPTATTTPIRIHNPIPNELPSPSKKSQLPPVKCTINESPVEQEKHLPIQAEFDWYNLDVEYGKPTNHQAASAGRIADSNVIDKTKDILIKLHGVEYNLDEEFSLAGSPDEIILNENDIIEPESPKTVCETFPIITESTTTTTTTMPCLKIKEAAAFDKFIDSSGLSTKALPRQRKIYFSGPFV